MDKNEKNRISFTNFMIGYQDGVLGRPLMNNHYKKEYIDGFNLGRTNYSEASELAMKKYNYKLTSSVMD